jgi:hypothetical protein
MAQSLSARTSTERFHQPRDVVNCVPMGFSNRALMAHRTQPRARLRGRSKTHDRHGRRDWITRFTSSSVKESVAWKIEARGWERQ